MTNSAASSVTGTSSATTSSAEPRYRIDRRTLIAAAGAIALAQIALAMPAVLNGLFQQDLGTNASQLTWISDAFLVPVTLFELTFGVLGDLFGRKRLLVIGTILVAVGEFIGFLTPVAGADTATKVAVLWTGQIITGIGAAAIMPTTLAMVAAGTHTPRDRARAISVWAAALATGSFVSPLIGGYLAQFAFSGVATAGWRWTFLSVVVLAAISLVLTVALAKTSSAPQGRSLDWPGQITVAIALFALLYGVIQGSTSGFSSPDVVTAFVVAVVFAVLFILAERRSKAPLLRLDLFNNRAFAVAAVATVFGMFAFLGTAYTTSIRLSAIQGFSPLLTSLAFVLLNGSTLIFAPVIARAMERYNPRWIMALGFGLIAVGDFWVSSIPSSTMSLLIIVAPIAIVGLGFALALHAITGVAVNTAPNHLAGMASSTTSLLRDFGFTLGPAVIGSIALSQAAATIQSKIASTPALQRALAGFYGAPDHATGAAKAALEGAVGAVKSGPLGANGVPATVVVNGNTVPFNPLHGVAFAALDHAYAFGYVVCGVAALIAALLAAVALGGAAHNTQIAADSLEE
jgi:MFS family permease